MNRPLTTEMILALLAILPDCWTLRARRLLLDGGMATDGSAAKRGLWSAPDPINPYQWRKAKR